MATYRGDSSTYEGTEETAEEMAISLPAVSADRNEDKGSSYFP